jgi:hypothetical protein
LQNSFIKLTVQYSFITTNSAVFNNRSIQCTFLSSNRTEQY